MKKLASYKYDIYDHINDNDLEKVASILRELSPETKTAELLDNEELASLEDKDFALVIDTGDSRLSKFAKYDKASTEVSLAFLDNISDTLPPEMLKTASTNLFKASKEFNLKFPEKLASYVDGFSYINPTVSLDNISIPEVIEKTAEESDDYAIPSKKKYPLRHEKDVEKALEYFENHHNRLDPTDALQYSTNVKKAALNLGIKDIPKSVEQFSNLEPSGINKEASFYIKARQSFVTPDSEFFEEYDNLSNTCLDKTASKALEDLSNLDKKAGLDRFWGSKLDNPAFVVFQEKKAERQDITLDQLKSIDPAMLTELVGNDAIPDLLGPDGVAVFNSLPNPIKKEIKRILESQ